MTIVLYEVMTSVTTFRVINYEIPYKPTTILRTKIGLVVSGGGGGKFNTKNRFGLKNTQKKAHTHFMFSFRRILHLIRKEVSPWTHFFMMPPNKNKAYPTSGVSHQRIIGFCFYGILGKFLGRKEREP